MLATTSLFVEYLVLGCQALGWLLLGSAAGFGLERVANTANALVGRPVLAPIALAALYTVGIFVDRAGSALFSVGRPERLLLGHDWIIGKADDAYPDSHMRAMVAEHRFDAFVTQYVLRIHVMRGAAFNSAATVVGWAALSLARPGELAAYVSSAEAISLGVVGVAVTVFFIGAGAMIEVGYRRRLHQVSRLTQALTESGNGTPPNPPLQPTSGAADVEQVDCSVCAARG